MTKTSTRESYGNTKKVPRLIFAILVALCLSLLMLYAFSGLPERLGLPVSTTRTSYINPFFEFDFPDPAILPATDGWYYLYAAQGITPGFEYQNIQVARSKDLVHWQRLPHALPEKPVWAKYTWDFWAPHVVCHDGVYYMYYSAEPDDGIDHIDLFAFDDAQSGLHYLYWGSNATALHVQELSPDRLSFQPDTIPISVLIPQQERPYEGLLEGAWVIYRQGFYDLFTSGDACCGEGAHYAVMVARSTSPTDSFEKLGDFNGSKSSVILEANSVWTAPGHNAIFTDPSGQVWIFYHAVSAKDPRHNDPVPNDDYDPRVLSKDVIIYQDGWPQNPGVTPSYEQQSGPSVSIDLFTAIRQHSPNP